jgi:hypothetical protein
MFISPDLRSVLLFVHDTDRGTIGAFWITNFQEVRAAKFVFHT